MYKTQSTVIGITKIKMEDFYEFITKQNVHGLTSNMLVWQARAMEKMGKHWSILQVDHT